MGGAMGSALEWALALLQAPGERHVLRQKPLPPGMDVLLGIAAGAMPEALADAARRLGEPESRIREAARFYAREVLFHPQADAYRMLGVEVGADGERIKAHHRLLQLWLHPDRAQSEDDAVFATRVNAAWNRLRSPERRRAYDEELRQQRVIEGAGRQRVLRSARAWIPADTLGAPSPWRRRLPVLALLSVCALLTWLVLRDMDRPASPWEDAPRPAAAQGLEDEPVALALPVKRAAPAAKPAASGMPRPASSPATVAAGHGLKPKDIAAGPVAGPPSRALPAPSPAAQQVVPPRPPPAAAPPPASVAIEADGACKGAACAKDNAPTSAPPSFERVQSALQAGSQLLRYLRKPGMTAPPIWSSPAVEASAERLRQQLHDAGRVRLAEPQWRVNGEAAVLTSGVVARGDSAGAGRLTARLQWREGSWLVTGVSMEHMQ